jgi:hypothetical protein
VIVAEQLPSVLITCFAVDVGDFEELVVVLVDDVGVPAPPALRYQFAAGSPRHCPTVTDL